MLITPSRVMDPACLEQRSGYNRGVGACNDLVRNCPITFDSELSRASKLLNVPQINSRVSCF